MTLLTIMTAYLYVSIFPNSGLLSIVVISISIVCWLFISIGLFETIPFLDLLLLIVDLNFIAFTFFRGHIVANVTSLSEKLKSSLIMVPPPKVLDLSNRPLSADSFRLSLLGLLTVFFLEY